MIDNAQIELVNDLVAFWQQAVVLRSSLGALLLAVVLASVRNCWHKRVNVVAASLWGLAVLAAGVFLLFPLFSIRFVISTDYLTRIRFIAASLSIVVLLSTIECIRHTRLQERYALLWLATGFTILLCALFPHTVDLLRAATGMEYAAAIVAVAFTFLIFVAFHFSLSFSGMRERMSRMSQRIAILEQRIEEMRREEKKKAP